jgi:hypothetical protein
MYLMSRGHWLYGIRHELFTSAQTLGSWVPIPLHIMDVTNQQWDRECVAVSDVIVTHLLDSVLKVTPEYI